MKNSKKPVGMKPTMNPVNQAGYASNSARHTVNSAHQALNPAGQESNPAGTQSFPASRPVIPAASLEHVSKIYGKGDLAVKALDDVSLTIDEGDWVAIVGASGSGKSTLMHLLGAVDQPTSGTVKVRNRDISGLKDDDLSVFRRREVGLIYQSYNLVPILTVKENILLPYLLDERHLNDASVDQYMAELGIMEKKDQFPSELSGGEKQRVAIARALINSPAMILADEPTGNLDTGNRDAIIQILGDANERLKQTVVLITHDEEVASAAKRIIELRDGHIVSDQRIRV